MEQLNEDKGQDEYYEGNSKKRNRQNCPLSYKILIFITVALSLLSLYLIFSLFSKKNSTNFLQMAESRFSVRKYDPRPVEKEKIEKLLRVAQVAPTAANNQPQKIYVITKDEDREKLKSVTKYTFNAPMFFVVCVDKDKVWKHKTEDTNSIDIDGSIIATHMLFEAYELGLGSVYVRAFQTEELKKLFNIPENIKPVALLPLGYPAEDANPAPSHFKKKSIDETVEYL